MQALAFSTLGILGALGISLRWNWWRPAKSGIPVLMYHKIGDPPRGSLQRSLWVSNRRFAWQMKKLRDWGYESVTFSDIKRGYIASKPVIITFDDGYENQTMNALPILQEFKMKAVFYIVAEAIGRDNFWHDPAKETRIPMMSVKDLKGLVAAGMEIGSHAMTHSKMNAIPFERAREELFASKKFLEELLNVPMLSFAFPYGLGEDVPDLVRAVHEAGYEWVLGVHAGIWHPAQSYAPLPRIFVRGDDAKFDFCLQITRGRSRL